MKKIFLFSFLSVLIDQIIKIIVSFNMELNSSIMIIKNFFNITYVQNTGAAFSILSGNRILLILVALLSLNIIYLMFIRNKDLKNKEKIVYGLLIGGIIGNLVDRIVYGYVIDYLDFNFFGYNYPIFNFADILITISVILILLFTVKESKNEIKSN